jgi:aspartate/methionine/tyrosine aminotransferase
MHALDGRLAGHPRRAFLVGLWRWVGSGSPRPDQGTCARGGTLVVMDLSPFRIERFYAQYERAVSLGSISKSYGLPGLRIGWIATRDAALRQAISALKDYTTICASAPSEFLTALALRNRHVLLDRNLAIVRHNLPLLDAFFERHPETFQWARPTASPIGFPRVTGIGNLARYCARLAEIGVLLLPGTVYDQPDHVRIGFGRANMPDALELLEANLTDSQ